MTPDDALAGLWRLAGLDPAALAQARLSGAEPALPSSFAIGTAAQATIAACGLAAAELWHQRGHARQPVAVDMRHAAVEFRSERHLRVGDGEARDPWDSIAGLYRTADGYVRLHTNFPHHREGVLHLLGCEGKREAVAAALAMREAVAFESEAAAAGMCVTALRRFEDWDAQPQGRAVAAVPLLIEKIGEAPVEALRAADRPLGGVRVLDFTRVIAGPVCGRTLAVHGADVLHVTAPHLPSIAALQPDTGRGKRACALDLRRAADAGTLRGLVREADVFVQGYRPGGLAELGFGPEALVAMRPGLICVSLSAYGEAGPWRDRHGFDSLVQTASGFNAAEAEAAGEAAPRALPAQALDHATGYLMAFGAMAALHRRAAEGGSWRVVASLAATGRWLRGLGRVTGGFAAADPTQADVADLLERAESGFGTLTTVRHAAVLRDTPASWERPAVPLGSHLPSFE